MNQSTRKFIKSQGLVIGVGIIAIICFADFVVSMLPSVLEKDSDRSALVTQELNTTIGSADRDRLLGTKDNDKLIGKAGNDELLGSLGNDVLIGGRGSDRLDGGAGIDTAVYQANSSGVTVDLSQGMARDESNDTDTLTAVENIIGSAYSDRLIGNDRINALTGRDGADLLVGKGGDDTFLSGEGEDILRGGKGQDTFVYLSSYEDADRLKDFETGIDSIKLLAEGFGTQFVAGNLPEKYFATGTKATAPEDYFIYDRDTGKLYFDFDGNGTTARVLIITFDGYPALSAKDIYLF